MFDERAFQSWDRILVGGFVLAVLFLGIVMMMEEVVGGGARLSRPAIVIAVAAFVGYVCTAWIIRNTGTSGSERDL